MRKKPQCPTCHRRGCATVMPSHEFRGHFARIVLALMDGDEEFTRRVFTIQRLDGTTQ